MDGRLVVRVMNAHPNRKRFATSESASIQAALQLESPETQNRIADEKKPECIALLRELIEAVVGRPKAQAGGSND
jgi:hypothetical protein